MSNPMQTHGALSWCELHADDPAAATAFYTDVLGWETEEMDMPTGKYVILKSGGNPVGGIMQRGDGGPVHWLTYITVDDVDARVKAAAGRGAKVIAEPYDVPSVGRMAEIEDPAGARMSFIAYAGEEG